MEVTSAPMAAMEAEVERDAEDDASPEIDFATYAAIETVLSAGGGPVTLLLAEHGVTSHRDYAAAREQFDRERAASAALDGAFQRMGEYFLEEYRSAREREQRAEEERAAERRAAQRAREAVHQVEIPEAAPEPQAATPEPPRRDLRGTAFSFEVPRGAELPFVAAPAAPPAPPPPPAAKPDAAPAQRAPLTGTSLALDVPSSLALPFPHAEPTLQRDVARPPAALTATRGPDMGPLPLPAMALPFRKGDVVPTPVASSAPAAPHLPPTRPRPALDGTALALDLPRGPSTPFRPAAPAAPRLSLEQHASLCAELARSPDREGEIMLRYGVDAAEKRGIDDHYRAAVAASPSLRASWNSAFQTYSTWLATQR